MSAAERDGTPVPEDVEWVDDGYGIVSWKRGWPEMVRPVHVALALALGLAGGAALFAAGTGVVVAVTGVWFVTLCALLCVSDALGRILPDRYVILATVGVTAGWTADAVLSQDVGRIVGPLLTAAATTGVFLVVMVLPLLLTGNEGMGAGDVKVAFPLALWLGRWSGWAVATGMVLGIVLAGAWVLVNLLLRRMDRTGTIALGPWLVLGTLLATAGVAALTR